MKKARKLIFIPNHLLEGLLGQGQNINSIIQHIRNGLQVGSRYDMGELTDINGYLYKRLFATYAVEDKEHLEAIDLPLMTTPTFAVPYCMNSNEKLSEVKIYEDAEALMVVLPDACDIRYGKDGDKSVRTIYQSLINFITEEDDPLLSSLLILYFNFNQTQKDI